MSGHRWLIIAMLIAAIPAVVFPIAYTVWFRWWKTPLGRALFTTSFALAALALFSAIRVATHLDLYVIRAAIMTVLAAGLWMQLIELVRVKYGPREMNGVEERSET